MFEFLRIWRIVSGMSSPEPHLQKIKVLYWTAQTFWIYWKCDKDSYTSSALQRFLDVLQSTLLPKAGLSSGRWRPFKFGLSPEMDSLLHHSITVSHGYFVNMLIYSIQNELVGSPGAPKRQQNWLPQSAYKHKWEPFLRVLSLRLSPLPLGHFSEYCRCFDVIGKNTPEHRTRFSR